MKGMIRSLCIAAGASALALPLAAVGTAAGASAQGSTQPLVLWEGSNVEAQNAVILKAFQAKTGIKVSTLIFPTGDAGYQDTLTKWAAGTRPDLLQWFGIGNYVAVLNPTQTLVPLTNMPFVKKTPASYLDNTVKYDGQIWAAMLDTPVLDTVSYNRNIFTQLKLSIPQNFNQLVSVSQTIKQKDPSVAPIAGGFGDLWPDQIPAFMMWNSYLQSNYAHIMAGINDNTIHFNDPQFVQGFQDMLTLQKDGLFNSNDLTQTWAQSVDSLMSGKAAMEFAVGPAGTYPTYTVAQMNSTEGIFTLSQTNSVGSWQGTSDGYYLPNTGSSRARGRGEGVHQLRHRAVLPDVHQRPERGAAALRSARTGRHSECLCAGVPPLPDELGAAVPAGFESGIQQYLPELDRSHVGGQGYPAEGCDSLPELIRPER